MQVHTYTQNIYIYCKGLRCLMLLSKRNPQKEKKSRGYIQYHNDNSAVKARTLDAYFPILYPFPTFPPQTSHELSTVNLFL